MGLYVKPLEGQELLSFLFGGGRKSYALFYKCIFRRDFLSPHTAIVSGIENYPMPAPACLVALMFWHCCYRTKTFEVCGPRVYISPRIHCRLYMKMIGILPRYNTMKRQLQSMSGTLLGTLLGSCRKMSATVLWKRRKAGRGLGTRLVLSPSCNI